MITDLVIQLVSALLGGILSALPAWTVPTTLSTALPTAFAEWVSWANGFFPLSAIGVAIGVLLGFRALLAAWAIAVWVYTKFPFKFT